jgi:parvulin-like peptidyl-prolyl isomerase
MGRQPTDAEFANAVKQQFGLDMPEFREQVRRQFLVEKYTHNKMQSYVTSQTPSAREIEDYYQKNKSRFVRAETVRFSIIAVPFEGNNVSSWTAAKETVDALKAYIGRDAARFDEKMSNKTINGQKPRVDYNVGEVYLARTQGDLQQVGQAFMNIAFGLKQGEISDIIENPRAYQIIKITGNYPRKDLELNERLRLEESATVRDYITNLLREEKITQDLFGELRKGNPFQVTNFGQQVINGS